MYTSMDRQDYWKKQENILYGYKKSAIDRIIFYV